MKIPLLPLLLACATLTAAFAAPTGESADAAFAEVARAMADDARSPAESIAICQKALNNPAALGDWLPAVKTFAALSLLRAGKRADAARIFESALLKSASGAQVTPLARTADRLARRWLTRLDAEEVRKALVAHYAAHVAYPPTLDALANASVLPLKDRFGDPWNYSPTAPAATPGLDGLLFSLTSKSTGRTTRLRKALKTLAEPQPVRTLRRADAKRRVVEFATGAAPAATVATAQEGGRAVQGVRLVKFPAHGRFALFADESDDRWIVVK